MTTAESREQVINFTPRGGILELFKCHDKEILIEGPANTGKTFGICWLLHLLALKYPGMRGLMCRKTLVSLTSTALLTFQEKVLTTYDPVRFYGGSSSEPASFRYQNGSRLVVGGMDNPDKILSSEYDIVYVNEATDLDVADWETLTTRLGRMGTLQFPRIIGDCNPREGKHWLNRRCEEGKCHRIRSTHSDNPTVTPEYMATLDALSGQRLDRLRYGLWVGVENAVYPHFDREVHIVPLPRDLQFRDGAFGGDYGRVHASAGAAVSVDQYGRRWVRESWAEPDADHGRTTARELGRMKRQYALRRGRVDPNQDVLIGLLGMEGVRLAEGARQARIDKMARLLNIFLGGHVTRLTEEFRDRIPLGPYLEPDSPGLLMVKGAPGIEELADEIESYHYVELASPTREALVVARIAENRIAALEYAIEELDTAPPPMPSRAKTLPVAAGREFYINA